jgi:2-phosphosulfolactate phosphatase
MHVVIKSGISGARKARGLGVLIDVFRGSSTVVALFARGVNHIIPVMSLSEAWSLKRKSPEYFLVGEKNGRTPEGFDCGNSPFEVSLLNLRGKEVVFRSSAASRGVLEACKRAEIFELLVGGFVNANCIATYIKEERPEEVTLVAMGRLGFRRWEKAAEDEYCAQYIKQLLMRKEVDFSEMKSKILEKDGAARLIKLGQAHDLKICLNLDLFDGIIPRVKVSESKMRVKISC